MPATSKPADQAAELSALEARKREVERLIAALKVAEGDKGPLVANRQVTLDNLNKRISDLNRK